VWGQLRSAWTVRFVICLMGIAAAAIIFLVTDFTWLTAALSIAFAVLSFAIAARVFRRRADPETVRRDLEERSREGMCKFLLQETRRLAQVRQGRLKRRPQTPSSWQGLTLPSMP
jgi:hypothetical protein